MTCRQPVPEQQEPNRERPETHAEDAFEHVEVRLLHHLAVTEWIRESGDDDRDDTKPKEARLERFEKLDLHQDDPNQDQAREPKSSPRDLFAGTVCLLKEW